jgi:hypothetical protein
MKNLLITIMLVILCGTASAQFERNPVRFRFYAVKNKTFTITKTNNIIGVTVKVPSAAKRDALISGDTLMFGGVHSSAIHVKPGEGWVIGGIDAKRIGKLVIVAQDSAYIIMIPARKDD